MSNELQVKVAEKSKGDNSWWEGSVTVSGLKPTKLVKKADGTTKFGSRSAVQSAARRLAKTLGFEGVDWGAKVAAKRSPRTTKTSCTD